MFIFKLSYPTELFGGSTLSKTKTASWAPTLNSNLLFVSFHIIVALSWPGPLLTSIPAAPAVTPTPLSSSLITIMLSLTNKFWVSTSVVVPCICKFPVIVKLVNELSVG